MTTAAERQARIETLLEQRIIADDKWRAELRQEIAGLKNDIAALTARVAALESASAALKNRGVGVLIGAGMVASTIGAFFHEKLAAIGSLFMGMTK